MLQTQSITGKFTRKRWLLPLLSGAVVVAVLAGALVFSINARAGAHAASAIQAKVPTYESFYMYSSSTSEAKTLGCNQGHAQARYKTSGTVVLDFGGQNSSGSGTLMINSVSISNGQIAAVAEAFSAGFKSCIGSSTTILHLGIGTNNSYHDVGTAGGKTWGNLVASIQNYNKSKKYYPQVLMYGANDIEPSWSSASAAIAWVNGFASVPGYDYFDYGSADGCPETSSNNGACNNGWNQYDVWYVSGGAKPARATPEIYYEANAEQWAMISLYAAQHRGGKMNIWGPWDEYDFDHSTFTSAGAWNAMWSAINSHSATKQNFGYSLEIWGEP